MNAKLRCQPGDLALVLRSTDAGKLVTCIELAGVDDINGPVWRIDRECMWADWGRGGVEIPLLYAPDSALMPIRPEPDPLDEEPMHDLSDDIGHFHQLAASGHLADILTRIVGRPKAILPPFRVAVVEAEQTPPMLWDYLERKDAQRRGAPLLGRITYGTKALVIKGSSTGTVVQIIERWHPPPACDATSLCYVDPRGHSSTWRPTRVWRTDRVLQHTEPRSGRSFRVAAAPEHALLPIFE